jgi:hypothetical protein
VRHASAQVFERIILGLLVVGAVYLLIG